MKALIEHQHVTETNKLLAPLLEGFPAVLSIHDADMKTRRRNPHPRLIITPIGNDELVFSLEGHGCEVMKVDRLMAHWLMRMGLTQYAARALLSEIESIYSIDSK